MLLQRTEHSWRRREPSIQHIGIDNLFSARQIVKRLSNRRKKGAPMETSSRLRKREIQIPPSLFPQPLQQAAEALDLLPNPLNGCIERVVRHQPTTGRSSGSFESR